MIQNYLVINGCINNRKYPKPIIQKILYLQEFLIMENHNNNDK
jgi:hypothetical protein